MPPSIFFEAIKVRAHVYALNWVRSTHSEHRGMKGIQAVYTVILTPEPMLRGELGDTLRAYICG
jgi:hypothetical protein